MGPDECSTTAWFIPAHFPLPLWIYDFQEFAKHVNARQRRRMGRGLQKKCNTLMVRLKADMKAAPPGERPDGVKTHVRR